MVKGTGLSWEEPVCVWRGLKQDAQQMANGTRNAGSADPTSIEDKKKKITTDFEEVGEDKGGHLARKVIGQHDERLDRQVSGAAVDAKVVLRPGGHAVEPVAEIGQHTRRNVGNFLWWWWSKARGGNKGGWCAMAGVQ